MNLLKSLKQRKTITIFFIIAFTIGILMFSIGNSAIVAQKNKVKEFSPENNKSINFQNYNGITIKDIAEVLKNEDITVLMLMVHSDQITGIETVLLPSEKELIFDMKDGEKFTKDQLSSNNEIALYSSRINEPIEIISFDGNRKFTLKSIGTYYEMMRRVTIPNGLFMELYGEIDVNQSKSQIILRGEPSHIDKAIKKLESAFKSKNIEGGIEKFSLDLSSRSAEGEALYNAAILIFFITILNSISISSLWVKNRKKEIVLRKVLGAKNVDISKIFFGELLIITVFSLLLSLVIQYILILLTGGFISNIDLRLNIEVCINSFMIAFLTSFAISLPSLRYISKIQPAEMLKGE